MGLLTTLVPGTLRRYARSAAALGDAKNPELSLLTLGRRRRCFVDVGANHGIYSRAAASLYDQCILFEPIPRLAADLMRCLPSNCLMHNLALSSFSGTAAFRIPLVDGQEQTELASLRQLDASVEYDEITVDVVKLDDLYFPCIDLIKIDVEGGEYDLLQGAAITISKHMPVLIVEIEGRHTQDNTKRIFDLMYLLNYSVYILNNKNNFNNDFAWRLMRGALYRFGWKTNNLINVDSILDEIYQKNYELNFSIVKGRYVNNFIFLPPDRQTLKYRVHERSLAEIPKPRSEWIVKQLKIHELVDEAWYLRTYPDVDADGMEPAEHYEIHGRHEGRNPRCDFDTSRYLDEHPDVRASGENPAWHSFKAGRARD